jgi:surfeit locus 1 family protein
MAGQLSGSIEIVGTLRWPDARSWFTPNDDPAKNIWFVRDPAAIAAGKSWGPVPPFYVEQEVPVPPGGLPAPGKLVPNLPNNHLQYAITWFGLAAVLAGVFAAFARSRFREGRA